MISIGLLLGSFGRSSLPLAARVAPTTVTELQIDSAPFLRDVPETLKSITDHVRRGDTLARIWTRNGGTIEGALAAAAALRVAGVSPHQLQIGEPIKFGYSEKRAQLVELQKGLAPGTTVELTGDLKSGFTANVIRLKSTPQERSLRGLIQTSLSRAASELELPGAVLDEVVDLFGSRIDFRKDLQPGDSFSVIYTQDVYENGEVSDQHAIQAASLYTQGKLMAAIAFKGEDGKTRYFDEQGTAVSQYFLRYPLSFTRISSVFSNSRFHPVLRVRRPHNGVDFAAPYGTPVRAVADGIILSAGYNGGSGKMIKIKHNSRYSSAYLHLSKINPALHTGTRVTRGMYIGNVGMSGLATGPHLHYSLYDYGRYVDPLTAQAALIIDDKITIPKYALDHGLDLLKDQHRTLFAKN